MNYAQVFCGNRIISAVKIIQFVSGRMSYIMLRGRWCLIIVLKVHVPTKDKIDYMKDSFYQEFERMFVKLLNTL
jgi:hypothetical protein